MVNILVTGGAGFIGSHLVNDLIVKGYKVRVLDNLHSQIHGADFQLPDCFSKEAEFIFGDIEDRKILKYALKDVGLVFHLAAETGVGQSMYEAERYTKTNVVGTAILWDAIRAAGGTIKLILASSRAVYGEGAYQCPNCGRVRPGPRRQQDLTQGQWSPRCTVCDSPLRAVATLEKDTPSPTSVYGITKLAQEHLSLALGRALDIPVVVLRFFNVYGSRQALSNPYTGILATFMTRLRLGKPLLIYEDGKQLRDFVHVSDVVKACILAAIQDEANFQLLNVGSGEPITILQLARTLLKLHDHEGNKDTLKVMGNYRVGDIRDCYADIRCIRSVLGYKPSIPLTEGLREFSSWADGQSLVDQTDQAATELAAVGLLRQIHREQDA